ncbi:putative phosphoesterase, ICC [Candidatus Methanoperedens nitroreducens]|uniref:Putative phosphoesterase, ICC n=1 Tax=Candidatus Methanoperedens nitratireducens TaxID=1392998 RepID=A0A062V0J9_9EURY|nr:metallophosphoesterase [Candidatus Methanoperedens nitroreducens]KCZ70892.1 putative phosphoesterase, ICC [Candidatus Methanoperedens nitroreducens]MDJ1421740.1 metallophosphoesterase [Candidatus Methanoperedens sp.]
MNPLLNEPALVVENTIRTLVIADIHLGIEWDLYNSGISIPSQVEKRKMRILSYIKKVRPDVIVLLGDIKHNVPRTSWQEKKEVPEFLKTLASFAHVDIVPGNHDGDIEYLIPENVTVRDMRGFVLDNAGYFHGHTWPSRELLSVPCVAMSHNHPTIRFTDTLGHALSEPVWIRTHFIEKAMREHYGELDWINPEVIIMPAFNELCGGIPFNESMHEELLGPVFSNHAIELERARAFLLDGTDLGTIGSLRRLRITRARKL